MQVDLEARNEETSFFVCAICNPALFAGLSRLV
jgi:hypothetical protein